MAVSEAYRDFANFNTSNGNTKSKENGINLHSPF